MKPYRRYLGVIVIAVILAFAFANGARASEANPSEDACIAAVPEMLGPIHAAHEAGMEPAVMRALVRSAPELGDYARGLILKAMPALLLSPSLEKFLAYGVALCALAPVPVAVRRPSEFDFPILDQHKDI